MTPGEVCAIIRASESHLYRLISRDYLPCFRVGSHYRLLREDVIRCLERETCPHD
jgi:excisionase family DNA binding protein